MSISCKHRRLFALRVKYAATGGPGTRREDGTGDLASRDAVSALVINIIIIMQRQRKRRSSSCPIYVDTSFSDPFRNRKDQN